MLHSSFLPTKKSNHLLMLSLHPNLRTTVILFKPPVSIVVSLKHHHMKRAEWQAGEVNRGHKPLGAEVFNLGPAPQHFSHLPASKIHIMHHPLLPPLPQECYFSSLEGPLLPNKLGSFLPLMVLIKPIQVDLVVLIRVSHPIPYYSTLYVSV